VAEVVWFLLTRDMGADRTVRRLEEPSFYPTGPGGDGLVIYELQDQTFIFRLWEIKKHAAASHISATATKAMQQLATRGTGYLAQYVAVAPRGDADLEATYSRLVDAWVDADEAAGAGIALGISASAAPRRRCFSQMQVHFPLLNREGQLEGLVAAIGDFPAFTSSVRGFVWNAL
jgi:hypothetical protein